MAKKSKRSGATGGRSKSKGKTKVKVRAQVGSKAIAKSGVKPKSGAKPKTSAKVKASVRRTFRKAPARKRSTVDPLARNKQLVLAFYNKIIGEKDYEGARRYMGAEYRQHAPYATDGHAGIAQWVRTFKESWPEHRYEVKKVVAEGDLVVLHLHGMNGPNPHGESVVDIFRIENGKVVEHWDVIQPIPETADNANTMF